MSDSVGDSYMEKQKVYVKTDGPVPKYLTAGKVYDTGQCRHDAELCAITDDEGDSIIIRITQDDGGCAYLNGGHWTLCDQHGNPVAEAMHVSGCCIHCGYEMSAFQWSNHERCPKCGELRNPLPEQGGSVAEQGDYAQALSDTSFDLERMTIERDRYKALAGELAEALQGAQTWLQGWASAEPYLSQIDAALAKHEQERVV